MKSAVKHGSCRTQSEMKIKSFFFPERMKDQAKRAEDNPENEIVTEQ